MSSKRVGLWAVPRLSHCTRTHYWGEPYCANWAGMRRRSLCGLTESIDFIRGPGAKLPKCKRCNRASGES
jgi:hypothetical protein